MQLDEALQLERRGATRALTLKVTPLPLPCCLKARLTHLQVLELLLEEEARKTVLALPEADLIAACKSSGLYFLSPRLRGTENFFSSTSSGEDTIDAALTNSAILYTFCAGPSLILWTRGI